MRDVSAKNTSLRTATARATIRIGEASIIALRDGTAPKGDPIPIARVAAIQAVKNTPQIIPYCHSLPIDYVKVDFEIVDNYIHATVFVKAIYRTGVEMEALTGAAAAVLNIYDLMKIIDDEMVIEKIELLDKNGGKSNFRDESTFTATVIVISDSVSSGANIDRSGALLSKLLVAEGGQVSSLIVIPDEIAAIQQAVQEATISDFVFCTGGTGLGPRDLTPEALLPIFERRLTGIEERLHTYSQDRIPAAMLSRLCAGQIGSSVIIALPGSPGACQDAVDALFPFLKHATHVMKGGGHDADL